MPITPSLLESLSQEDCKCKSSSGNLANLVSEKLMKVNIFNQHCSPTTQNFQIQNKHERTVRQHNLPVKAEAQVWEVS